MIVHLNCADYIKKNMPTKIMLYHLSDFIDRRVNRCSFICIKITDWNLHAVKKHTFRMPFMLICVETIENKLQCFYFEIRHFISVCFFCFLFFHQIFLSSSPKNLFSLSFFWCFISYFYFHKC